MSKTLAMEFGSSGMVRNVRSGVELIGTDDSGNTSQSNFELSGNLNRYRAIQILVYMNWSSSSDTGYQLSPQIPIAILDAVDTDGLYAVRQVATGSNSYVLTLTVKKVDDTHIALTKSRTTYSFRTIYIYGIL